MLVAMNELGLEHDAKALNPYLGGYYQQCRKHVDGKAPKTSTSTIQAAKQCPAINSSGRAIAI